MTYEKTLKEFRRVIGDLKRPDEISKYVQKLLELKGEVVEEVLSHLNLPEDTKGYLRRFLNEFYDTLLSGAVEELWRKRYDEAFENVRKDVSMEISIFIASELASTLARKVMEIASPEDAEKIVPYIVGAVITSLAFASSARADMEYDFLGITSSLMERIRKFGAEKGKDKE